MENIIKGKGKAYKSILLRESCRDRGKVKNRTLLNLTHHPQEEIEALRFALKNKNHLEGGVNLEEDVSWEQGSSVGGVWTVYQVAKSLGIEKALGYDQSGKLALWQIIARSCTKMQIKAKASCGKYLDPEKNSKNCWMLWMSACRWLRHTETSM